MNRVRKQIEAEWQQKEKWMDHPITVAVLDTGIGRHPDLTGRLLCFKDFVKRRNLMYDINGHGTHICGILCGSGNLSAGKYQGIAPNTRLVVGKVLDDKGDGMTENMLEGLQWIIDNRMLYNIRVLNISVGIGNLNEIEKEMALKKKIEEVWESGVVVVCAAGNKGPIEGSISSIGGCNKVITVGCHDGIYCRDKENRCETYSGRGILSAAIRKPDIVAPGTNIVSCNIHYQRVHGTIKGGYIAKSGTSMATSIVSGGVALLLQKYPDMKNDIVKQKMIYTATDLGEAWNKQGWGMININRLLSP